MLLWEGGGEERRRRPGCSAWRARARANGTHRHASTAVLVATHHSKGKYACLLWSPRGCHTGEVRFGRAIGSGTCTRGLGGAYRPGGATRPLSIAACARWGVPEPKPLKTVFVQLCTKTK